MLKFVGEVEVNTMAWESGPWEPSLFMKVSATGALFLISKTSPGRFVLRRSQELWVGTAVWLLILFMMVFGYKLC